MIWIPSDYPNVYSFTVGEKLTVNIFFSRMSADYKWSYILRTTNSEWFKHERGFTDLLYAREAALGRILEEKICGNIPS